MSSHRDRRREDDRDTYPRKGAYPNKEPPRETAKAVPPRLNEYFIEGEGISREVLQIDICKHLGPEATSRPATYNGKSGFLIKALRPFTPAQLEDLKAASEGYRYEASSIRRQGGQDPPYEYSETRARFNQDLPMTDQYYAAQAGPSYGAGSAYPPTTGPGYPTSSYPSGSGYPAYTTASGQGNLPAGNYPTTAGGYPEANYTYSQPGAPGYPQDYYQYPQGTPGYDTRPRGEPVGPGYRVPPQDLGRGGYMDDRPMGYYDPSPSASTPSGYAPTPSYRPSPSAYDQPPVRDAYNPRQPQPQPQDPHYRRR
ncbi:hypothetical protein MMC30_005952 [Trapelia coarctata]|nr:hypothetical protein [Trapelia coarctata]